MASKVTVYLAEGNPISTNFRSYPPTLGLYVSENGDQTYVVIEDQDKHVFIPDYTIQAIIFERLD